MKPIFDVPGRGPHRDPDAARRRRRRLDDAGEWLSAEQPALAASKINPCLWFDTEAEDAAKFYCSVFKNSRMGRISRYVNEGQEIHGKEAGSVMAVEFELDGQKFAALNGGPHFKFTEAVSFQSALPRPGRGRLFLEEALRRAAPRVHAAG